MTGLLAGAISMALGEWILVQSSAEQFASQLVRKPETTLDALAREELGINPG